jgi:hypothetical protein
MLSPPVPLGRPVYLALAKAALFPTSEGSMSSAIGLLSRTKLKMSRPSPLTIDCAKQTGSFRRFRLLRLAPTTVLQAHQTRARKRVASRGGARAVGLQTRKAKTAWRASTRERLIYWAAQGTCSATCESWCSRSKETQRGYVGNDRSHDCEEAETGRTCHQKLFARSGRKRNLESGAEHRRSAAIQIPSSSVWPAL